VGGFVLVTKAGGVISLGFGVEKEKEKMVGLYIATANQLSVRFG
jgi:hypothetical protein